MHTFLKTIRNNNLLMALVILGAYYLIVKVLKYLVKLVRRERYTNSNTKCSSFLQKQLEGFRNKRREGFKNRKKLGKSTNNSKINRSKKNRK